MQPTFGRRSTTRFFTTAFRLTTVFALLSSTLLFLTLVFSTVAVAQDSPGRFEVGGNFTALRLGRTGLFGPGLEGDFNFGRHFALDGAYSWLPTSPSPTQHVMAGLFGGKVGTRTEHFGFFGKVRPGFISISNTLREETITLSPGPPQIPIGSISSIRFGRLTEKALDFGGVMEYYPARHWALRWDFGDTVVFQEKGPALNIINLGPPPSTTVVFPSTAARTTNNFQFSTGVHYRF